MNCEAVTDRLIDLLYEEIDGADAEKARAHLAECESCKAAFDRISAGHELASFMKMEEPPRAVRSAVLAAARERASERSSKPDAQPARAAAREAEEEHVGLWAAFVRWLGGHAMGPQVAMATTLLLMVGIGLWYLPELRRRDAAEESAILDPSDEVGPSAGLTPAEPLELEADPRTGRIRPREAEEAEPAPRVAEDEAAELPAPTRERNHPPDAPPAVISDAIESPETSLAQAEIQPGESMASGGEEEAAPPAAPRQQALAMQEQQTRVAPMPSMPQPQAQPQAPRVAVTTEGESVQRPDTDVTRLLPQALEQRARSYRAAGNCRQAIGAYEQLLARNPQHARASELRIELGECYTRIGRLSDARRVLELANRDARVANRAQTELRRLETAERAQRAVPAEAESAPTGVAP